MVATTVESVPGTTLITYMVFNTLFCLLGAKYWTSYGFFRMWSDLDGGISKMANNTTGWVDDSLGKDSD
jgi:hypothetical protein